MNKVIFTDVDGTLINYQTICPESAFRAVNQARRNGHKVVLCTGCSKYELSHRNLPETDGLIGANGGYVEYHGKVIMHNGLTPDQVSSVVSWCRKKNLGLYLESNSGLYCNDLFMKQGPAALARYVSGKNGRKTTAEETAREFLKKYTCLPDCLLHNDDTNKISFVLSGYRDYLDAVKDFPELVVNTWGGKDEQALFGDLSPHGINKKQAVRVLLEHLGIDSKDTIAFGDARIDLPMFELCGYSVAMGNGGPEAKRAADHITDDVDDDGLYKAFMYLGLI
ncbi:MAG: HAD family hydrolase [Erysipelotrichaceae bacterium]|nr:HAD family hydrolase [Erysipelotrichaceae bacterium]